MMDQLAVVFWLVVIVVPGFVGSLLIARNLSGIRGLSAFLIWLPVPFVVLAIGLAGATDPTLTASQATYNYQLAFVLVSIGIAIPWGLANLAGAIIGRARRKRSASQQQPSAPRAAAVIAGAGLPDWSRADNPSLSLAEISVLMHAIAARAGFEERSLPHVGPIAGDWGAFIDRDKFDYIYMELERGGAMFDLRTVTADQLLYWIFRDRAYAMATTHMARNATTPDRYDRLLAERQQEILAAIDPRWGAQFTHERARETGR